MTNPKKLTLLSSIAVRKNKLNEGIADEKVKTVVNKVLKKNKGGLYHVNSYAEGEGNNRIYLMKYCNGSLIDELRLIKSSSRIKINSILSFIIGKHNVPQINSTQPNVFYFIDQDALSKNQIDKIREEFEIIPGHWSIKRNYDNDTIYQMQFENKIKELGVDLYVFNTRNVKKNFQYSGNGLDVANKL